MKSVSRKACTFHFKNANWVTCIGSLGNIVGQSIPYVSSHRDSVQLLAPAQRSSLSAFTVKLKRLFLLNGASQQLLLSIQLLVTQNPLFTSSISLYFYILKHTI
jgi:hypothetical protein